MFKLKQIKLDKSSPKKCWGHCQKFIGLILSHSVLHSKAGFSSIEHIIGLISRGEGAWTTKIFLRFGGNVLCSYFPKIEIHVGISYQPKLIFF
jgi:hypothetical protein